MADVFQEETGTDWTDETKNYTWRRGCLKVYPLFHTTAKERQTTRCIKKANWGEMERVTVAVIKYGLTPISVMISTPVAWHKNHYLLSAIKDIFAFLAGDKNFLKVYSV